MTLDTFHAITEERIPTADEFTEFVRSMGWSIRKEAEQAFLRAPKTDPVALALARMLKREPWRTKVLAPIIENVTEGPPHPTAVTGEPRPREKPPPQLPMACPTCQDQWEPEATTIDRALLCSHGDCPAKRMVNWDEVPRFSVMQSDPSIPNFFGNSSEQSKPSKRNAKRSEPRTTMQSQPVMQADTTST